MAADPLQSAARRIATYLAGRYPQVRLIESGLTVEVSEELGFLYLDIGGQMIATTPGGNRHATTFKVGDVDSEFDAAHRGVEFLQAQLAERDRRFPSQPTPPYGVQVVLTEGSDDAPLSDVDVELRTDEAAVFDALTAPWVTWFPEQWKLPSYETGTVPTIHSLWSTADLYDVRLRFDFDAFVWGSVETVDRLATLESFSARVLGRGTLRGRSATVTLPVPPDPDGLLPQVARALRDDRQRDIEVPETTAPDASTRGSRCRRVWRALRDRPRP